MYLEKKKKKGSPYQGFTNLSCSGRKITNKHNANLTNPSPSLVQNVWRFLMIQRREVWSHHQINQNPLQGNKEEQEGWRIIKLHLHVNLYSNAIWMCSKALPALHKQGFSFIFTGFCIFKFLIEEKKKTKRWKLSNISSFCVELNAWSERLWFSKVSGAHSKNSNNLEPLCGRWSIKVNQQKRQQLGESIIKINWR